MHGSTAVNPASATHRPNPATEGVIPTSHPLPMTNAFRDDVVTGSLDRDEILAAAPDTEDGYFKVPKILDES